MLKQILFWWISLYCLGILIYSIYASIKLYRLYLKESQKHQVIFRKGIAFRRLIENWLIWFVVYLVITLAVGILYILYQLIRGLVG